MDGSDGYVTVDFKGTTWVAKYENATYCSGTYKYTENTATLTVTDAGISGAEEGDTGTAIISGNKMTVSDFDDEGMNGTFTKKSGGGEVYSKPYLPFRASKTTVKNYESRELLNEFENEGIEYLLYSGENEDVYLVAYAFEYNYGLYDDLVWLNNTNNIKERVFDFLSGKYKYMGEDEDGVYVFMSSDETIAIGLYYDDEEGFEGWLVEYIDASLLAKSSFPKKNLTKHILSQFN